MFAGLPDRSAGKGAAAPVYSVAIVGLIWLPIPFRQWAERLTEGELSVVVSAATTSGRGEKPLPTGILGILTPKMLVRSALSGGSRSASSAARSTTKPTIASATKPSLRIPSPRISIKPASCGAGRTNNSPPAVSRWTRSSPTRMASGSCQEGPLAINSKASRDLPAPDGPRIRTARSPTLTAEACTVVSGPCVTAPAT